MTAGAHLDAACNALAVIAADLAEIAAGLRVGEAAAVQPPRQTAEQLLHAHNLRGRFFHRQALRGPSWMMLLALHAAEQKGREISASALCSCSEAPESTALKHLAQLHAAGWVVRTPDALDRRRFWITLSPAGRAAMAGYLKALATASARPMRLVANDRHGGLRFEVIR